jgi:hypothetical protein
LPKAAFVNLKVFDVLGNEVAELVDEIKPAGVHEINFNSGELTSGIYLYRIKIDEFEQIRKMIYLK